MHTVLRISLFVSLCCLRIVVLLQSSFFCRLPSHISVHHARLGRQRSSASSAAVQRCSSDALDFKCVCAEGPLGAAFHFRARPSVPSSIVCRIAPRYGAACAHERPTAPGRATWAAHVVGQCSSIWQ